MPYAEGELYTVSELNALVREMVEEEFGEVSVLGEVSNFKRHSSGHLYFTLKDADAQLRAVCFRGVAGRLKAPVDDGLKVVVQGRLTVYEPFGQYQIIARDIQEAGEGELERAFRELKVRLEQEGLFDPGTKREIPEWPLRIAVVTSPTGAAIRDILSTLGRRWPCAEVLILPVHVQGDQAAPEIVRALDRLPEVESVEVVIVGRGGGSLEDLWAFNEEEVARAIHRCPIPVVSAVGHETDVTISDFVADVRAATPTMAAEIVVPRREDVVAEVDGMLARLERHVDTQVKLRASRLRELLRSYALGRVRNRIEAAMQSLDYLLERSHRAAGHMVTERRSALDRSMDRLRALSPKDILSRGYTICADAATGAVLRGVDDAVAAGTMAVTFADGSVTSEVKEKRDARR
ncbi:MAG: exodeoxyribonuclease VII large subunit [Candidatus Latescibacterota bacterium]|jgi:exodeoxyribonuclease VII large subunit